MIYSLILICVVLFFTVLERSTSLSPPAVDQEFGTHEISSSAENSKTEISDITSPEAAETKRSSNPLDVCNLTSRDPPKSPPTKKRIREGAPKLWSPVETIQGKWFTFVCRGAKATNL